MEVKKLRKKLGMTQAEFALKLGVAEFTVRRWENDKSKPSRLALRQLTRLQRKVEKE